MKKFAFPLMIAATLFATPALAESPPMVCAPRATMVETLANNHQETLQAVGIIDKNAGVLEMFATSDNSTWTMVVTNLMGISCAVSSGEHWLKAPKTKVSRGRDG